MVSHDFPLIRETFTGLLIHKSHHSSLVFFAFLDENTPRKMMEKAFLSVYVSKFSGEAGPPRATRLRRSSAQTSTFPIQPATQKLIESPANAHPCLL